MQELLQESGMKHETLTPGDPGYDEALAEVPFIKPGLPGYARVKTYADSVAEAEAVKAASPQSGAAISTENEAPSIWKKKGIK